MRNSVAKILSLIPDRLYLRLRYRMYAGKSLNLRHPQRFNEKLQWLKLYNRKPEYTVMADKVAVKDYIAHTLGPQYVIPTLGVWEKAADVDFDALPEKFVIKCNHNSGDGMYICTDKSKMDVESVRRALERGLEQNYYLCDREWPYKNIPRRILAEAFLDDGSGKGLIDYKVFNFNGEPHFIQVDFDRFKDHKKNLYSTDWKLLDFEFNYPSHPEIEIPKPAALDEMLQLSRILSKDIPYLRTDFYYINGQLYLGELTFFPASGYGKFTPDEYDLTFGKLLNLPSKKTR